MENWLEVNIVEGNIKRQNVLLVFLFHNIVSKLAKNGSLMSWHFFREFEPIKKRHIRFRLEVKSLHKDRVKRLMNSSLAKKYQFFFGNHGQEGAEYIGEAQSYGEKAWLYHKKVWQAVSELAVCLIEGKEIQGNVASSREQHLIRLWHLAFNQIFPENIDERELHRKVVGVLKADYN